jgi:hypothetical protein
MHTDGYRMVRAGLYRLGLIRYSSVMRQMTEKQAWQLSDLADEARFPSAGWVIPAYVVLDGAYVRASASLAANATRVFPDRTLLGRFVLLEHASDESVLRFAKRWGLLGFCRHGLLSTHTLAHSSRPRRCSRRVRDGLVFEPLASWRAHAGMARATLSLAAALYAQPQKTGDPDDWALVGVDNWRVGGLENNLSAILNRWLDLGGVVPRFTWLNPEQTGPGVPRIVLEGDGLFGGLAAMLLLAVARSERVVPCSEPGCSTLAERSRRGATPYCATHGGPATRSKDRSARFRRLHPGYYRERRARVRDSRA